MDPITTPVEDDTADLPGGAVALDRGCRCSVLANAAFRAGLPGETALVDPLCLQHSSVLAPATPTPAGPWEAGSRALIGSTSDTLSSGPAPGLDAAAVADVSGAA